MPKYQPQNWKEIQAVMFWKLAFGNPNVVMGLTVALPPPTQRATSGSWKTIPMSQDDIITVPMERFLSSKEVERLAMGHIPNCQEDHWFMYFDSEYLRIYRSWTGMCVYEAHLIINHEGGGLIDSLKISQRLSEFGINGTLTAKALFEYLLVSLVGETGQGAWYAYLGQWLMTYNNQDILLKEIVVAGTSHCEKVMELYPKIHDGERLKLRRSPKNKFDPFAIGIYFKNHRIGWVPKEENEIMARLMDRDKELYLITTSVSLENGCWLKIEGDVYMSR